MKNKIAVALLTALTLLFAFLALWSALAFIIADNWIAKVLGFAVVAIVIAGIWALIREIRFGANTEKLASILEREGKLPEDNLPRVRGRIDREAADQEFENYRRETEADPKNWRSWYRLGLAYDAAGDRKRARAALRDAISMYHGA
ncbi:tetratricopeptide repeat protein [Yaniella halotolerans]|uniref:tetratricopeptide repeat protein n=1 Tax=Yaniella halotolerans TaxID=225453 RepID=UPI0003B47702|nr:tetratricopeptide repeat protein [Yaniella halotolerans]